MATIINNPPGNQAAPASDGGSGMGLIVGIILAVVVVFLFVVYGLPAMRGSATPQSQNSPSGGINVNVPDKINVDIKK
ncbi:MAG: hypothetical protein ABI747_04425 [Candidatus Moraniibacteriota bacterium]